jgi:uncharacterized damage-inducible protein DinB
MTEAHLPAYRILPLSGFTPTIGRLVAMLAYARETTLKAVEALTREQLDHQHDERSNSLRRTRETTLTGLAARDDGWLEAPLRIAPILNAHWAWFHVAEDEINHRGQIRWLRARLP